MLSNVSSTATPSFQQTVMSPSLQNLSTSNASFTSQMLTPGQNSFQTSPMPGSMSLNNMDMFGSGAKSPFGDLGGLNGTSSSSASGGQFLNNNGIMPSNKQINSGTPLAADPFGLL